MKSLARFAGGGAFASEEGVEARSAASRGCRDAPAGPHVVAHAEDRHERAGRRRAPHEPAAPLALLGQEGEEQVLTGRRERRQLTLERHRLAQRPIGQRLRDDPHDYGVLLIPRHVRCGSACGSQRLAHLRVGECRVRVEPGAALQDLDPGVPCHFLPQQLRVLDAKLVEPAPERQAQRRIVAPRPRRDRRHDACEQASRRGRGEAACRPPVSSLDQPRDRLAVEGREGEARLGPRPGEQGAEQQRPVPRVAGAGGQGALRAAQDARIRIESDGVANELEGGSRVVAERRGERSDLPLLRTEAADDAAGCLEEAGRVSLLRQARWLVHQALGSRLFQLTGTGEGESRGGRRRAPCPYETLRRLRRDQRRRGHERRQGERDEAADRSRPGASGCDAPAKRD